jgi:hypothetical protein
MQLFIFDWFYSLICHSTTCNYCCSDCYSLYFGNLLDQYMHNEIPEGLCQSRFSLKCFVLEVGACNLLFLNGFIPNLGHLYLQLPL